MTVVYPMRFLPLLCVLTFLALLSGCRKKSSPEFFKLEADQSILLAREGDDAYVSPEMTAIISGLQTIPDDTLEKPRAVELAAKLTNEQARVTAERVVKPKPPPVDPFAGRLNRAAPVEVPPAVVEVDAGPPSEPWTGMDEATFTSLFGKCFSGGPKSQLANGTPATSQVLGPSVECQKRLGTPGGVTSYLFVDGGVWGKIVETTTVIDAGRAEESTPPPPPPPRDAGEPILTIPGAPLPEGYQKTTVY